MHHGREEGEVDSLDLKVLKQASLINIFGSHYCEIY